MIYQIRQCPNPRCNMRYPVPEQQLNIVLCPRCGAETQPAYQGEIRDESGWQQPARNGFERHTTRVEALLDNIRSSWNVGSMFRTAEGVGIQHMYCCGFTPTPQVHKVKRTSLGAEQQVGWSQHNNAVALAGELIKDGRRLWALETLPHAHGLAEDLPDADSRPVVLIVGNEITGIDPELLALCERVVYLPMEGSKRSYNAAVAFGIAAFSLRYA